jgi:hypothetical protein
VQNLLNPGPDRLPATVSQLLSGQPEKLRTRLWHPLCVSALNTAPEHALYYMQAGERGQTRARRRSNAQKSPGT